MGQNLISKFFGVGSLTSPVFEHLVVFSKVIKFNSDRSFLSFLNAFLKATNKVGVQLDRYSLNILNSSFLTSENVNDVNFSKEINPDCSV